LRFIYELSEQTLQSKIAGPVARAGRRGQSALLALARHGRRGGRISFLAVDAPVAEFVEGDWLPCDGATHKSTWANDSKIAVEIFDFGFARIDWATINPVHAVNSASCKLCHSRRVDGTSRLRSSCYNALDSATMLW